MSMFAKAKWILGLAVVFLLILATGQTNVVNFQRVQASIEQIYEDRLVVKGLIFDLAAFLHGKELALARGDTGYFRSADPEVDAQIGQRLAAFRATRLTSHEAQTLDRFAANVAALQRAEAELELAEDAALKPGDGERLTELLNTLDGELRELSAIQLAEGRRQLELSGSAIEDMDLIARFEAYMLAFLAIMMVVVVVFIPKKGSS